MAAPDKEITKPPEPKPADPKAEKPGQQGDTHVPDAGHANGSFPAEIGKDITGMPSTPAERQKKLDEFKKETSVTGNVSTGSIKNSDGSLTPIYKTYDSKTGVENVYIPKPDGSGFTENRYDKATKSYVPSDGKGEPFKISSNGQITKLDNTPVKTEPSKTEIQPPKIENQPTRNQEQFQKFEPPPVRQIEPRKEATVNVNDGGLHPTPTPQPTDKVVAPPGGAVDKVVVNPSNPGTAAEHPTPGRETSAAWSNMTAQEHLAKHQEAIKTAQEQYRQGTVDAPPTKVDKTFVPPSDAHPANAPSGPAPVDKFPAAPTRVDTRVDPPIAHVDQPLKGQAVINDTKIPGSDIRPGTPQTPAVPRDGDIKAPVPRDVAPTGKIDVPVDRAGKQLDPIQQATLEAKLAGQLQTLGRNPEGKINVAEFIAKLQEGKFQDGKFQDGKFLDGKTPLIGKEVELFKVLSNMKPEELGSLKAFLSDGSKTSFDFKHLDGRTQQDLAKVFDSILKGGTGERSPLFDLLGDKARGFDKIPSGDQSRILLTELLRAMKDMPGAAGLAGRMEANAGFFGRMDATAAATGRLDIGTLLGRSMGADGRPGEFHLQAKDSEALQALLARLQSKDFLTANQGTLADRAMTMRLEGKVELKVDAKLDGKTEIKSESKVDALLQENRTARLSEAVREALGKSGEISRGLGPKEQAENRNDAQQRLLDTEALKSKIEIKSETKSETAKADALAETKTKQQQQELDEITKKKQLDENLAESKRLHDQLLAQQLKEQQEREEKQRQLDERNEKERQERELKEKQKQDEKKKQEDNERIHIVAKGDTLNSLAKRYFNNKSYAEIIFDRNKASINVVSHKGRKYSDLQVKQKIMIPNQRFVDNFKQSMISHRGIDFGGVNYGSVEDELKSKYGINWDGTAAFAGTRSALGAKDSAPIQRRSFSGKGAVQTSERRESIESMLGPVAAESSKTRKQTVHLGQTIKSIANKLYGSPAYWRLLALKNNLSTEVDKRKDPVVQLHRGQMLRLPDADEIASFQRDPDNPVVVSLYTDDYGLFQPLTRRCGNCERDTLSMAVVCVSCGFDMDCPVEDDFEPADEESLETDADHTDHQETADAPTQDDDEDENKNKEAAEEGTYNYASPPQSESSNDSDDPLDQIAAVELQSVTFVDRKNPMGFNKENGQTPPAHEFAPPIEQTPPEDNLFKLEFENEGRDPLWTPEPTPEIMDPAVQIIEYGISHGDVQGLCISLQIVCDARWSPVFDYHIFPDGSYSHQYVREGGRKSMKKLLPPQQLKQLAHNHLRNCWEQLCRDYMQS